MGREKIRLVARLLSNFILSASESLIISYENVREKVKPLVYVTIGTTVLVLLCFFTPLLRETYFAKIITLPLSYILLPEFIRLVEYEEAKWGDFFTNAGLKFFISYVVFPNLLYFLRKDIITFLKNFNFKLVKLVLMFILLNVFFSWIYYVSRSNFEGFTKQVETNKSELLYALVEKKNLKLNQLNSLKEYLAVDDVQILEKQINQIDGEIKEVVSIEVPIDSCVGCLILDPDNNISSLKDIRRVTLIENVESLYPALFRYSFLMSMGQTPNEIQPITSLGIAINFAHLVLVVFVLLNMAKSYLETERI